MCLLLNRSAEPALADEEEQSPLHIASGNGQLSIVKRLLRAYDSGTNKAALDIYGQTALHLAARRGHESVVCTLIAELGRDSITLQDRNNRDGPPLRGRIRIDGGGEEAVGGCFQPGLCQQGRRQRVDCTALRGKRKASSR